MDVSSNFLRELPQELAGLQQLKTLNLSNNKFAALPDCLAPLQRLETVRRGSVCAPTAAVAWLTGPLHAHAQLDLSHNRLTAIPPLPTSLRVLNLAGNRLEVLPEHILCLPALEELDVSHNTLALLPTGMSQLAALRVLIADANALTALPAELARCAQLQSCSVQRNRIASVPPEVLRASSISKCARSSCGSCCRSVADGCSRSLNLAGNLITREALAEMDGFEEFQARRKQRLDRAIASGIQADMSLCGL